MPMTLIEHTKTGTPDPLRDTVIEIFVEESRILQEMPITNIQGAGWAYNVEAALPGIAFRGINESYTPSTGVVNREFEPLMICGGDLDFDTYLLETQGANRRATETAAKIRALALVWTKTFIKGDSVSEPREFDGLQVRLVGRQRIDAGTTSGGDALALYKLDEAIDLCDRATHIIMNKTLRRRLSAAARDTTVGGFVTYEINDFGQQVMRYQGLPILEVDEDEDGNQILGFTEAAPVGGQTQTTSVYVVSFMDDMCHGIQSRAPVVRDLGEISSQPVLRTRMEWFAAPIIEHPRAAVRLRGVTNAAVVK